MENYPIVRNNDNRITSLIVDEAMSRSSDIIHISDVSELQFIDLEAHLYQKRDFSSLGIRNVSNSSESEIDDNSITSSIIDETIPRSSDIRNVSNSSESEIADNSITSSIIDETIPRSSDIRNVSNSSESEIADNSITSSIIDETIPSSSDIRNVSNSSESEIADNSITSLNIDESMFRSSDIIRISDLSELEFIDLEAHLYPKREIRELDLPEVINEDFNCFICSDDKTKKIVCEKCNWFNCVKCYIKLFKMNIGKMKCPNCRNETDYDIYPFEVKDYVKQLKEKLL